MTTETLKKKIVSKIMDMENEQRLEYIYQLIEAGEDEDVYILSDEQIKRVDAAEKEIKYRKVASHEEANKEIEEWLKSQQ